MVLHALSIFVFHFGNLPDAPPAAFLFPLPNSNDAVNDASRLAFNVTLMDPITR
jgi:hypothetical protein